MSEREAFLAGFMVTGEGYNGEYPGSLSNDPEEEAKKQYEKWACDHEFGNWEYKSPATHGDREKWVRECMKCPESEWGFRDAEEAGDA